MLSSDYYRWQKICNRFINQVFIQINLTAEALYLYDFITSFFIRDAPGISEKDENRSTSTKVPFRPRLALNESAQTV